MFSCANTLLDSGPVSQHLMEQFPVLLDYAGRIHDNYFPDYEKWGAH